MSVLFDAWNNTPEEIAEREREKARDRAITSFFYVPEVARTIFSAPLTMSAYWLSDFYKYSDVVFDQMDLGKSIIKVPIDGSEMILTTPEDFNDYAFLPFKHESWMSSTEVLTKYFARHNADYVTTLDKHIHENNEVKGRVINPKTKAIVVIAAMNEVDIDEAIITLRNSLPVSDREKRIKRFEEEISVIVFHNYHGSYENLDHEVKRQITLLKQLPNVHIFEQEVPEFSNVGFAKKFATDLAMRVELLEGKTVPLILLDADVVDLTKNIIDDGLRSIEEPSILASSAQYDYDLVSQFKFPVWGFRCEIMNKMLWYESISEKRLKKNRIRGACAFIHPRILAILGGLSPFNYTDIQFTTNIREAVQMRHVDDPISSLVYPEYNHMVQVNPSKEIKHMLRDDGTLPEAHWLDPALQQEESGKMRFRWEHLSCDDAISLLSSELDNDKKATVLREVFLLFQSFNLSEVRTLQMLSTFLLRVMVDKNIEGVELVTTNGAILRTPEEINNFLKQNARKPSGEWLGVWDVHLLNLDQPDKCWKIIQINPLQQ